MTTVSSVIISLPSLDIGSDTYNDFINALKLFPFVEDVRPLYDSSESVVNVNKGKRYLAREMKKTLEELIKQLENV